jgi:N-acetylglutamate synthase-like GNAT family acetyltransferase
MALKFQDDYEDVCFKEVADLLHFYGLTDLSDKLVEMAFRNSYAVVFVKNEEQRTIGCGRAISDGVSQGMILNIALEKTYHHRGIGREIMHRLVLRLKNMIITLYTHPNTLNWYQELGFSRLNTTLVRFREHEAKKMAEWKFIDKHSSPSGIFEHRASTDADAGWSGGEQGGCHGF